MRQHGATQVQAEEGTEGTAGSAVQARVVEILANIRDRLRILGADSMKGQAEVILKGHLSALRNAAVPRRV